MGSTDQLVAIGHSHCGCLTAAEAEGVTFKILSFWFIPGALEIEGGTKRLSREVAEQIRPPLLSFMGGGAHTVLSLGVHPRPFDFVLPEAPDLPLDEGAEILPYDAVRRRLEADAKEFLDLTEMLLTQVKGPIFHVDTPPPVASGEFMKPHIPWQYFPGRLQEVSSRWHRYRMWRLNTDIARAHARKIGVGFIGHPKTAEDADGFLDPRFCSDGIHGNEAYGDMLAAKIVNVVRHGRFAPGDFAPTHAMAGAR